MSVLRFLGLEETRAQPSSETETVRKITRELDAMAPGQARYIAAFAYILSRVARSDLIISEEETAAMEELVAQHGELSHEQAMLVVQMAKTQNLLFGATEDFLVTREFKRIASHEQKIGLLHCLFAVSAADETISGGEDNAIRQISRELGLEHHEFIEVRLKFRDQLSFLKRNESSQS